MNPVIVTGGEKKGTLSASIGDFQMSINRSDGVGPRSIELVLLGLATCTYATVFHYMARKELSAEGFSVEIRADASDKGKYYEKIYVDLRVNEQVSERERLIILKAAKSCRIHNTLENRPSISLEISS